MLLSHFSSCVAPRSKVTSFSTQESGHRDMVEFSLPFRNPTSRDDTAHVDCCLHHCKSVNYSRVVLWIQGRARWTKSCRKLTIQSSVSVSMVTYIASAGCHFALFCFVFFLFVCFVFEIGFLRVIVLDVLEWALVNQAGLELTKIYLPLLSKCWD